MPASPFESFGPRFAAPPAEARPMVRWWWFGGGSDESDVRRELTAMRDAGLGGAELAFVYPLAVGGPDFGSPEFLARVTAAAAAARELGLRLDLTLGSGWPYGGPHVRPEHAAQRLRWQERPVGPASRLERIRPGFAGEEIVAVLLAPGVEMDADGDWSLLELEREDDGSVRPRLPRLRGPARLLVATAGPTEQHVKRASAGAEGHVLDHFSADAIRAHLAAVGEPLLRAARAGGDVHAVFCDSLEVYGSDWTPGLPAQFRRRRGYDLLPVIHHLRPDAPRGDEADRMRIDLQTTLAELFEENFLAPLHAWAREHDVLLRVQNYGQPPARVSGYRHADIIEGESWGWRGLPQTRWAASAAHHLGATVCSSEVWTWVSSPSFAARPVDLLGEAHEHLLNGVNHLIGHGWPSSPHGAPAPGWAFYAAGAITATNAWWPVAPELFASLQRLCWAQRQGEPVADIGVWLPYGSASASFSGRGESNLWKACAELLGEELPATIRTGGYDLDLIDAQTPRESIARRHRAVVVAAEHHLSAEDARALRALAQAGAALVVVGEAQPRLPEARVCRLAELPGVLAGIVPPDMRLEALGQGAGDPAQPVGVVHRRWSEGHHTYLVVNTGGIPRQIRLHPREPWRDASVWDPADARGERTEDLALDLPAHAARLVLTAPEVDAFADLPPAHGPAHGAVLTPHPDPAEATAGARTPAAERELPLSSWRVVGPDDREEPVVIPHRWEEDEARRGTVGTILYRTEVGPEAIAALGGHQARVELGFAYDQQALRERTAPQAQSFQATSPEPIGAVARVRVDGRDAGAIWQPPYRLEITGLLDPDGSTVELEVSSTSLAALREPAWRQVYADAEEAFGRRFTMQDLEVADRPIASGLLAPVVLRRI